MGKIMTVGDEIDELVKQKKLIHLEHPALGRFWVGPKARMADMAAKEDPCFTYEAVQRWVDAGAGAVQFARAVEVARSAPGVRGAFPGVEFQIVDPLESEKKTEQVVEAPKGKPEDRVIGEIEGVKLE